MVLPEVETAIGCKLEVGGLSLSPFSQLELRNVKVTQNGAEPLAQIVLIRLRYSLLALIAGKIQASEITIEKPVVTLMEKATVRATCPSSPRGSRSPQAPSTSTCTRFSSAMEACPSAERRESNFLPSHNPPGAIEASFFVPDPGPPGTLTKLKSIEGDWGNAWQAKAPLVVQHWDRGHRRPLINQASRRLRLCIWKLNVPRKRNRVAIHPNGESWMECQHCQFWTVDKRVPIVLENGENSVISKLFWIVDRVKLVPSQQRGQSTHVIGPV